MNDLMKQRDRDRGRVQKDCAVQVIKQAAMELVSRLPLDSTLSDVVGRLFTEFFDIVRVCVYVCVWINCVCVCVCVWRERERERERE